MRSEILLGRLSVQIAHCTLKNNVYRVVSKVCVCVLCSYTEYSVLPVLLLASGRTPVRGSGIRDNNNSPWTTLDIVRVSKRTLETIVPVVSTCRSASSSPSSWRPWRARRASARSTSTGWRRASPRRLVRVRVRVRVRVGVGVKARVRVGGQSA